MNSTLEYMLNNNMINTNTSTTESTESKEETAMMNTIAFEENLSVNTNIAINKIEVTFERFTNLKGTEVERTLRTLASVMAEADRHLADGDQYFDYSKDKMDAEIRINMLISLLYKKEGDIETITKDLCYKNGKAEATELSDHYWAFCK